MLKTFLYSVIYVLISIFLYKIDQVQLAAITSFKLSLAPARIDLSCNYSLAANEKLVSVSYSKNGQTFVQYNNGPDITKPNFTSITGINSYDSNSGEMCRFTILNYMNPESMGLYLLMVKYTDAQGKEKAVIKRSRISLKVDKCQYSWVNITKADKPPKGSFVNGMSSGNFLFYACCNMAHDRCGYFEPPNGCLAFIDGAMKFYDPFQILVGTGLSWIKYSGDFKTFPANAFVAGKEGNTPILMGRCIYGGFAMIGKITDNLYLNYYATQVIQDKCENNSVAILTC